MKDIEDMYKKSYENLFFILGPCVIESQEVVLSVAKKVKELSEKYNLLVIFKSSFDKANRTSINSYRGPGLDKGLEILHKVKQVTKLPVTTDIHEPSQAQRAAKVVDVIQIPAFLCRQTDLLIAAGETDKIINIKKGQFLAPWDILNAVYKVKSTGNNKIWLTERGTSFGYNNLVVDFRSIPIMQQSGCPVIFDATHSVQLPGGKGASSGGKREYVPHLSSCAVAAGCNGIFMEVHPDPDKALCDGPNSWPLDHLENLIKTLLKIKQAIS
ncbi:3-deoxy-8-phosphooctulonate synthase [Desulfothermus okinawensis JCM 13304]